MIASQYVCAPDAHAFAQLHEKDTRHVAYIKTQVHVRGTRRFVYAKTWHQVVASSDRQRVARVKPYLQNQIKKQEPIFFATRTKW